MSKTKDSSIKRILNRIDPISKAQTSTKMHISALIDDAMKEQGISETNFSEAFDVSVNVINLYLSGTFNFTVDELVKISKYLDIELVTMYKEVKG